MTELRLFATHRSRPNARAMSAPSPIATTIRGLVNRGTIAIWLAIIVDASEEITDRAAATRRAQTPLDTRPYPRPFSEPGLIAQRPGKRAFFGAAP